MHWVTPQIALGSLADAVNAVGVDTVMTVCEETALSAFPVTHAPFCDDMAPSPSFYHSSVAALSAMAAQGQSALLHCHGGISRSPAVLMAYRYAHEGLTFAETFLQLQALGYYARPHPLLIRGLHEAYGVPPVVQSYVGIAGPSGSGKSTLAHHIVTHYGADKVTVVPLDNYYHDNWQGERPRVGRDYDDHLAIDFELLRYHLTLLALGLSAPMPVYDCATGRRRGTHEIVPRPIVLLEGLYALWHTSVRSCFDASMYLDMPLSLCRTRRIYRDMESRGKSLPEVLREWDAHVMPAWKTSVVFQRTIAGKVLTQEMSLATVIEYIEEACSITSST